MNNSEILQDESIEYNSLANEIPKQESFTTIFLGFPKPIKLSLWLITTIVIGVYFVITLFIGNIILFPMSVKGVSMYPTLNIEYEQTGNIYAQDVVYLWKTHSVKVNDVIVFKVYDNETSNSFEYYIKRVIAKSGDTVQFKRSSDINENLVATYDLYVNDELVKESYIAEDMIFNVQSQKFASIINEEKIEIPQNCIYVMGDNRNHSEDSRELGCINLNDVVGKVLIHVPYGDSIGSGIIKSIKQGYLF